MTVRTVSNLPAAMHVEMARCLFAIELSKQSWVIAFITPLPAKISRRILSGCDWKGLLDLIEEVRARVSRETGRAVDVLSCYEADYAHVLKELADRYFTNAKTVVLVQDNLNIHGKGSLYEAFPAAEARRLVERF